MARTQAEIRDEMAALAPTGQALPQEQDSFWMRLLHALAAEPARFEARVDQAHDEADPRSARELLPDWERVTGLPDECSKEATTIQERRAHVHAQVIAQGGQSKPYFQEQCEALGYLVTIKKYGPFVCGLSRCGDRLGGHEENRFYWSTTVHGPRVTYFRCGESECGDYLAKISLAEDLECRLRKRQPGQGELIFAYEEE